MPPVIRAKDDQQHLLRLAGIKEKKKSERKVKTLTQNVRRKRFSELSAQEKDDILKAVAIQLGFVRAD